MRGITAVVPTTPPDERAELHWQWKSTSTGPAEDLADEPMEPRLSNGGNQRHYVTLKFEESVVTKAWTSGSHSQRRRGSISVASKGGIPALHVRNFWCFASTFSHADGQVDARMEEKFARNKYQHFRGAFMQMSFLMPLGVFGQAVSAALERFWIRAGILLGVALPMYLVYGLFVYKMERSYLHMSGTRSEKILVALLCIHSLAIVAAEFMRPDLDYGMLVMHIGFVHNFCPLSEMAIHLVTIIFGLLPYVVLKVLRTVNSTIGLPDDVAARIVEDPLSVCYHTRGEASQMLEILMPTMILLYQGIVTMGRFNSMRIDMLSGEVLSKQRDQLKTEKQKCEGLLTSMLPKSIIESLKANENIDAQLFQETTVVFIQICDFSKFCQDFYKTPEVIVEVLNLLYLEFDRLSDLLHVYKVETVCDVYMAVVGCPTPTVNHADVAAHFALSVQECMRGLRQDLSSLNVPKAFQQIQAKAHSSPIQVRVGLNSGKLRAGVVGLECPRYKLVGDTVNVASRMESTCHPGNVQCSQSTREKLTPGMFDVEDRGDIAIKGKGNMKTYFVKGYLPSQGYPTGEIRGRKIFIEHGTKPLEDEDEDGLGDEIEDLDDVEEGDAQKRNSVTRGKTDHSLMHLQASSQDKLQSPNEMPTEASRDMDTPKSKAPLPRSGNSRKDQRWKQNFHRFGVLDMTNDREPQALTRYSISMSSENFDIQVLRRPRISQQLSSIFLLVPPSEKAPAWMETLREDKTQFLEETLQRRISSARNLTIIWLLILAAVNLIDVFLDALREDVATYSLALTFRAVGNNIVGLVYLLLITNPHLFRKYAQTLTLSMLVSQGTALLACGFFIYNSDPAIIAMFGAYVLFYKVISISQRLITCALAVLGYVVIETVTNRDCNVALQEAARNVAFLAIFFGFMACGVRLEEHLEHVAHYEQRRVAQRLMEIQEAKLASSTLLESLLPPHIVDLVNEGVSPISEVHSDVTIMFTDIKGFTAYSASITPQEVVDMLNSMYSAFDEIIVNWDLYKVEIIGDAYFISSGCPTSPEREGEDGPRPDLDAMRAVEVGLALQRALPRICQDDADLAMRVGMHTGSVVAGVVGKKGPRYHLFGAAVGYAEKMESNGVPGRVHISDATHKALAQGGHDYEFQERKMEIDGERELQTTWLVQKSNNKAAMRMQKEMLMQRRNSGRALVAGGPLIVQQAQSQQHQFAHRQSSNPL